MINKSVQTKGPTAGEDMVGLIKNKPNQKISLRKKAKTMLNMFDESQGSTDSDIQNTYGFDPLPSDAK